MDFEFYILFHRQSHRYLSIFDFFAFKGRSVIFCSIFCKVISQNIWSHILLIFWFTKRIKGKLNNRSCSRNGRCSSRILFFWHKSFWFISKFINNISHNISSLIKLYSTRRRLWRLINIKLEACKCIEKNHLKYSLNRWCKEKYLKLFWTYCILKGIAIGLYKTAKKTWRSWEKFVLCIWLGKNNL